MSHRSNTRLLITLPAIALVAAGIVFGVQQLRPVEASIPTVTVKKGNLRLDTYTTGQLHTPHSAMLVAPPISGTLQIIHILPAGTAVKAGDVVVEFDPSEQEFNLAQSRSQVAEAEQQIVKARDQAAVKAAEDKVALLKAQFDVRRAELEVSRNELVSDIDAKKNQLNLEEAKRKLEQLQQDMTSRAASDSASIALLEEKKRSSMLAMQVAQQNINNMKLTSPIDGRVSIRDNMDSTGGVFFGGMSLPPYREGDLVFSGRFLAEVLDTAQMEAVGKIYESDRSNVSAGETAEVRVDAQPQNVFPARVKTVAGMTSNQGMFGNGDSVKRFDVTFELLQHPSDLRPGTAVSVVVKGNEIKEQLYLPGQCVFDKDGKLVVYLKKGSHFEAFEPKIKFRTEDKIAVENLPEGTEVALVNPDAKTGQQKKAAGGPSIGGGR